MFNAGNKYQPSFPADRSPEGNAEQLKIPGGFNANGIPTSARGVYLSVSSRCRARGAVYNCAPSTEFLHARRCYPQRAKHSPVYRNVARAQ